MRVRARESSGETLECSQCCAQAPGYPKLMAQREHEWELKEKAANEFALRVMRTFIPTDIAMCTVPELMKRAADKGLLYTTDFAQARMPERGGGAQRDPQNARSACPFVSTSKANGCCGGSSCMRMTSQKRTSSKVPTWRRSER